jgi:serine/threonine protein kinase
MSRPDERSRVGSQFGPYRLRRLIGRGGIGEVYEAEDTVNDRIVALKLFPYFPDGAKYRTWLDGQANSVAQLSEPHTVPIHGHGEIDGVLYIDMPLIDGIDLGAVLKRDGPISPARAVAIAIQVACALDAAHASGVMHGAVKPQNILITRDDFAYVVDFGVASGADGENLTDTCTPVGTFAYMAPERFTTDTFTSRADIYSLACVLYECLSGSTPYLSDNIETLIAGHVAMPVPRPSEARSDIPKAFDEVIARGMAKKPEDRYASAGDLVRAAAEALYPRDAGGAESGVEHSEAAAPPAHVGSDQPSTTADLPLPDAPSPVAAAPSPEPPSTAATVTHPRPPVPPSAAPTTEIRWPPTPLATKPVRLPVPPPMAAPAPSAAPTTEISRPSLPTKPVRTPDELVGMREPPTVSTGPLRMPAQPPGRPPSGPRPASEAAMAPPSPVPTWSPEAPAASAAPPKHPEGLRAAARGRSPWLAIAGLVLILVAIAIMLVVAFS